MLSEITIGSVYKLAIEDTDGMVPEAHFEHDGQIVTVIDGPHDGYSPTWTVEARDGWQGAVFSYELDGPTQ